MISLDIEENLESEDSIEKVNFPKYFYLKEEIQKRKNKFFFFRKAINNTKTLDPVNFISVTLEETCHLHIHNNICLKFCFVIIYEIKTKKNI